MFSCVWLHFKKCFGKYFLMFGGVLENTIENTFSTCCSHFLTFSRLPNDYIISFIPQNTNKTQKKIIKSEQTKARSRSARSRSARSLSQSERSAHRAIAIAIDAFTQCVDRDRAKIEAEIAIGATAPANDVGGAMRRSRSQSALSRQPVMSADGDVAIDSFFLPLSFSLFLFYFPRLEVL